MSEVSSGALEPSRATDNELIEAARRAPTAEGDPYLEELYRRFYPRVAYWCVSVCGNREEAADLAQEVFLRVHARLDTFRMDSLFSTWLYKVMRSVAINRGLAARRRRGRLLQRPDSPDPVDPAPDAEATLERSRELQRLRRAMERDLDPLEARVLYLHYVDGLSLPAITRLLSLTNKSGAKAFVVSGKRKLRRRFLRAGGGARSVIRDNT